MINIRNTDFSDPDSVSVAKLEKFQVGPKVVVGKRTVHPPVFMAWWGEESGGDDDDAIVVAQLRSILNTAVAQASGPGWSYVFVSDTWSIDNPPPELRGERDRDIINYEFSQKGRKFVYAAVVHVTGTTEATQ